MVVEPAKRGQGILGRKMATTQRRSRAHKAKEFEKGYKEKKTGHV